MAGRIPIMFKVRHQPDPDQSDGYLPSVASEEA